MIRTISILALVFIIHCNAFSQNEIEVAKPQNDNTLEIAAEDTLVADEGFVMAKSPLGAVLRSAIIPGWGQFYNESYWKIPLVLGVTGFLVYGWITEHNDFAEFRDLYDANKDLESPTVNLTQVKLFREFYRNRRDTYAWWFGVFYLLQIADAFVDAHLYDFDVSDEVHVALRVNPFSNPNGIVPMSGGSVGLQIKW